MFGSQRRGRWSRHRPQLGLSTIGPPNPDVQPDPDTWIAGLGSLPLVAQPGERWLYNTGASVLGVLVARAAGQPFGDVLRTRLFEPLGMRDTAFWTTRDRPPGDRLRSDAGRTEVWDEPDGRWSRPPAFGDGAGGPRVDRGRPAGVLADAAARWRAGPVARIGAGDDAPTS